MRVPVDFVYLPFAVLLAPWFQCEQLGSFWHDPQLGNELLGSHDTTTLDVRGQQPLVRRCSTEAQPRVSIWRQKASTLAFHWSGTSWKG